MGCMCAFNICTDGSKGAQLARREKGNMARLDQRGYSQRAASLRLRAMAPTRVLLPGESSVLSTAFPLVTPSPRRRLGQHQPQNTLTNP